MSSIRSTLLLILLTNTTLVVGQFRLDLGVRGGVNYVNNIYKSDNGLDNGNEYRFGYHIGVLAKLRVIDRFYLVPEISWNNKGYHRPATSTLSINDPLYFINSPDESNTHLNYISIPVVLEFRPIDRIGVQLGPEFGYLISVKEVTDSRTNYLLNAWEDFGFLNDRMDVGLIAGVDVHVWKKLNLGARYVHGFSSLFDKTFELTDPEGNSLGIPNHQNRTVQLSVSYFIF